MVVWVITRLINHLLSTMPLKAQSSSQELDGSAFSLGSFHHSLRRLPHREEVSASGWNGATLCYVQSFPGRGNAPPVWSFLL